MKFFAFTPGRGVAYDVWEGEDIDKLTVHIADSLDTPLIVRDEDGHLAATIVPTIDGLVVVRPSGQVSWIFKAAKEVAHWTPQETLEREG